MLWLTAPLVLLSVLARRHVNWRGRIYELNSDSKLAVPVKVSPDSGNGFTTGEFGTRKEDKGPKIKDKTA
jgi:hypothetical protein